MSASGWLKCLCSSQCNLQLSGLASLNAPADRAHSQTHGLARLRCVNARTGAGGMLAQNARRHVEKGERVFPQSLYRLNIL